MPQAFLKTLVKQRHALVPLIYEFNMLPARYIHESWLHPILNQSLFEKLRRSARSEKRLSTLILRAYELDHAYFFDFEDPVRRLALIDRVSLARLIYLTGGALNASRISRTVEKSALLSLKGEIGEKAYLFATKKAPFLMGRMAFPFAEEKESKSFRSHIVACGVKCLEACFLGEPSALVKRLQFKLPKRLGRDFGQEDSGEDKSKAWSILRKVLLQEVEAKWATCFS